MSSITAFPDAVVQDYTPGVMLTLEISSADIEKCRSQQRTVEVNFKSFFKPLKSKLDIVKCSKDGADTSDVGCDGLLRTTDTNRSSETAKPSLVNDNIIDRLVRKYYSQATFQGNDYDSGDSSDDNTSEEGSSASNQERDSDNDTDVGSSELVFVNVRKGGESRRLRQECVEDYYDPEDPFIDDSDKVFEIEADLRMHKTKTKHNGFFVSVGKLHVTEIVDDHQESPPKKRSIHRSESDSQRPKISWRPVKEVQLALTRFSDVFVASGVKLVRSSHVPFRLEDDLLALNRITLSHYPAALDSNALSYVESVHEILGEELPVGRVRTTLTRLVAKDNADSAGARLDEMVAQLCADLRPLVIPCPDAMQPANKVKAQQTASAPECAAQESVVVAAPLVASEATATTALTTEGASDDVAVQGAASEVVLATKEEEAKPLVVYKWYCKWSAATRAQALAVWQQTVDWVRLENVCRAKMGRVSALDEKDAVTERLRAVADSLPESCCNGDLSAVRKAVSNEKNRLKKIQQKEALAKQAALSWVPKALSAPGLASASEDMQGSAAATVSLSSPKKSTAAGAERSPTKRPRKPSIAQFAVLDSAVQENSCSVPVAGLSEGAPRRKRVKKLTTAQFTATPATAISAQAHESLPVGSPHRLESSAEVEMRNEGSVEATTVQPESAFAPSTEFAELS